MPRKKLDKKADATLAFRISSFEKEKLESLVDKTRLKMNSRILDSEYRVTKNEIIITALKIGLRSLQLKDLPKRYKLGKA